MSTGKGFAIPAGCASALVVMGLASSVFAQCTSIETAFRQDTAGVDTHWYFYNVESYLTSADVQVGASVTAAETFPSCAGNIFPNGTSQYVHKWVTGAPPLSASVGVTLQMPPTVFPYDYGFGSDGASEFLYDGWGGGTGSGTYRNVSKYWYDTDSCGSAYFNRACAGGSTATYAVTPVDTFGGSKLQVYLSPQAVGHLGTIRPCGSEFQYCPDPWGLILVVHEEIIVKVYSGITPLSTTSIVGGATVSGGVVTSGGYMSSLFVYAGTHFDDQESCEGTGGAWSTIDHITESGTHFSEISIPMNATSVGINHCYWVEAMSSEPPLVSGEICQHICVGDLNGDGAVDSSDFDLFWSAYELGSELADINGNGGIDSDDLAAFMNAYENGC